MNASTLRGFAVFALVGLAAARGGAVTLLTDNRNVSVVGYQTATPSSPFSDFSASVSTGSVSASQLSSVTSDWFQSSGYFSAREGPGEVPTYVTATSIFDVTFRVDSMTSFNFWSYRELSNWGENTFTLSRVGGIPIASITGPTLNNNNTRQFSGLLAPGIYEMKVTTGITAARNARDFDHILNRYDFALGFASPGAVPDGGPSTTVLAGLLAIIAIRCLRTRKLKARK